MVLCLTLASIIATFSNYISVHNYLFVEIRKSFVRLFYLDWEANIPTWYASSMLLLCSIILAIIALAKRTAGEGYVLHWSILSIIFLCLSLDESAIIHEMGTTLVQCVHSTSGFLLYAWIIPGATFIFIFVLVYMRFLFHLPTKTRCLFLVAGIIYVTGAIVMESISGQYADLYGEGNIKYQMIITVEEFFEMLGVVVFVYALLSYSNSNFKEIQFCIQDK